VGLSVSERMMGEEGLVMAVMVLMLHMTGTMSSCVSLSSVSKWITMIGNGTSDYGEV